MAEAQLNPHVPAFAPIPVKDVKVGETKYWCRCGLSKKQPWCDGSHKGTGITPLQWKVDKEQDTYYICNCKQSKNAPFCDGTHAKLDKKVIEEGYKKCTKTDGHKTDCKLCTGCGWVPDF